MAKTSKNVNLLDLIPVQNVDWEKKEDGTVSLKLPKTRSRLFKAIIIKMGKKPHFKVHLDEFGSFVWEQCNGIHRVDQIGNHLKSKFGKTVEPVYDRLGAFVRTLASQKCITYKSDIESIK